MFIRNLLFTVFVFSFCLFSSSAKGNDTEAYLDELDELIEDNSANEKKRDARIQHLVRDLEKTKNDKQKFEIMESLFRIYRSFQIDSAFIISQKMIQLATNLDSNIQQRAQIRHAEILLKIGRPRFAIRILNRIPRTEEIRKDLYFYQLYYTAYNTISLEEKIDNEELRYAKQIEAYTDTILDINSKDPTTLLCAIAGENLRRGNNKKAIEMMESLYTNDSLMTKYDRASIEYILGEYYLTDHDTTSAKLYYAKSVLSDMKLARKVYKSLPRLAMICYLEDDTERAYRYITKTMYDVTSSHARYRILDITDYLPIITEEHDKQQQVAHKRIMYISIILAVLLLMLIIFYILLNRKNRIVEMAEKKASAQNVKLQELSDSLKISNERIRESDHIKDEYIALLFNTCSEYIHMQEVFKKKITRKLASNQVSEVMKFIEQQSSESDNFKQFIHRFDVIYNSIFPTFVEDFNQLLRPEEQIRLKPGELLTPELRIYALIRLGITENCKIANFLHYSLQTVYNYRQRMRNKAIDKSESLSKKIMELSRK